MAKLSLSFKGRPIAVYHFDDIDRVVTIGRNPTCTLVIDSLAVAPLHARITPGPEGGQVITAANELPTLINRQPIKKHLLAHGDVIQIGKHTLTFAADAQAFDTPPAPRRPARSRLLQPPPIGAAAADSDPAPSGIRHETSAAAAQPPQPETCVQIVNGHHFGRVIPITGGLTRLGISGQATAVIARRREGYFLSHLEGGKPPCVNGRSIQEHSRKLSDGDRIQIGNVRMIFHQPQATASSRIAADG